jgi:hypothetical protein
MDEFSGERMDALIIAGILSAKGVVQEASEARNGTNLLCLRLSEALSILVG